MPKDCHIPWSCILPSRLLHISEPAVGLEPASVLLPSSIVSKKTCSADSQDMTWNCTPALRCSAGRERGPQKEGYRDNIHKPSPIDVIC